MTSKCFSHTSPNKKKIKFLILYFLYVQLRVMKLKPCNKLHSLLSDSKVLNNKFIFRISMLYYKTFLSMNKCMLYFNQIGKKQETMFYYIFVIKYQKLNSLPLKCFILKIFKIGARSNNSSLMYYLSLSFSGKLSLLEEKAAWPWTGSAVG